MLKYVRSTKLCFTDYYAGAVTAQIDEDEKNNGLHRNCKPYSSKQSAHSHSQS